MHASRTARVRVPCRRRAFARGSNARARRYHRDAVDVPVWGGGARGSSVIMLTAGIDDAGGTFKPFGGAPVGTARKFSDDPKTGATTGRPCPSKEETAATAGSWPGKAETAGPPCPCQLGA